MTSIGNACHPIFKTRPFFLRIWCIWWILHSVGIRLTSIFLIWQSKQGYRKYQYYLKYNTLLLLSNCSFVLWFLMLDFIIYLWQIFLLGDEKKLEDLQAISITWQKVTLCHLHVLSLSLHTSLFISDGKTKNNLKNGPLVSP